jgi:hypothetical protein
MCRDTGNRLSEVKDTSELVPCSDLSQLAKMEYAFVEDSVGFSFGFYGRKE